MATRTRAFALLFVLAACAGAGAQAAGDTPTVGGQELSMHTVFSAECTPYFDWQSLALVRSHREVRHLARHSTHAGTLFVEAERAPSLPLCVPASPSCCELTWTPFLAGASPGRRWACRAPSPACWPVTRPP